MTQRQLRLPFPDTGGGSPIEPNLQESHYSRKLTLHLLLKYMSSDPIRSETEHQLNVLHTIPEASETFSDSSRVC